MFGEVGDDYYKDSQYVWWDIVYCSYIYQCIILQVLVQLSLLINCSFCGDCENQITFLTITINVLLNGLGWKYSWTLHPFVRLLLIKVVLHFKSECSKNCK